MRTKPSVPDWLALVFLTLIWGSSFILVKKGLESFSGMQVGALRIVITFTVLLPFAIMRIRSVPVSSLKLFFLTGIIGSGIPPFLFGIAQMHIDSSLAGVLNSLTPLFTLCVGVLFFSIKTNLVNITGVILAMVGVAGLLTAAHNPQLGNGALYGLLVVGATVLYGINLNTIKKYLSGYDPLTTTSLMFAGLGLPAALYLFMDSEFAVTFSTDPHAWASFGFVAILAIMGSAVSMVVHNWLIKRTSALFASTVTYIMPVVSIFWGILDGEVFMASFVVWIVLILSGVYLSGRVNETPKQSGI